MTPAAGIVRLDQCGSRRERSVGGSPGALLGFDSIYVDRVPGIVNGRAIESSASGLL